MVTSVLLLFILVRGLYGNIGEENTALFRALTVLVSGVITDVPFAGALGSVTPVFEPGGLQAFFLSPMVWTTVILCVMARRHANIVTRMLREDRAAANAGNQIGNIRAGGNVHIHQVVGTKPAERASSGAVVAAVLTAVAPIICALIKAWMTP